MKLNFRKLFGKSEQQQSETASAAAAAEKAVAAATAEIVNPDSEELDDDDDSEDGDIFVVNEHERWRNDLGWSCRNLEVGDPKRYVSKLHQSDASREAVLPSGWQYVGSWKVDTTVPGCDSGWLYGFDFRTLDVREDIAANPTQRHFVRRKRWYRKVAMVIGENALNEDESRDEGSISSDPNDSGYSPSVMSTADSLYAQSIYGNSPSTNANSSSSILRSRSFKSSVDDEEVEEEDEEPDEDVFQSMLLSEYHASQVTLLKDPALINIGKKMKALELECRKEDDLKMKEFNTNIEPSYKRTIKELDQRISELRKRIQNEISIGNEHIALLEQELQAHLEVQDSTKRSLYFPNSNITLGSGGVYFALDDFWLEYGSGQFVLDLVPSKETPQIILLLTGAADGNDSGVAIRFKICGFKLRGDSGKGVPRLSLDTVKITVTIRVTLMLTYSMTEKKWTAPPNNFRVEMLAFKGPFGLSRSVVSGILTIVVPILREQLLAALPPELGMFISSLPSPLSVRGEFNVKGTELKHLSHAMFKSEHMCSLVGYTPEQLLKWIAIQKSIGRSPLIKTMQDLLTYRRFGTTHHKQWDEMRLLWNRAAIIYFDKTNGDSATEFPISFERILQGTDEILRNPLRIKFTLHNCDGQFSLRSVIDNTQLFFERWRANSKETSRDIGELVMILQKFNQQLDLAREALALTTEHLDFIDLRVVLNLLAGSHGEIGITVSDILAQAPLSLWTALPQDLSFGFESPVPFLTTVRPQKDGGMNIEILHCGSKDIQQRATFYEWESGVGRTTTKPTSTPTPGLSSKSQPQTPAPAPAPAGFQKADQSSVEMPSVNRERSYESADSDRSSSTPRREQQGQGQQQQQQQIEELLETASYGSNDSLTPATPPKPSPSPSPQVSAAKDTNDIAKEPPVAKPPRRQSLLSSFGYSTPQTSTQILQTTGPKPTAAPSNTSSGNSNGSTVSGSGSSSRGVKGRKKRVDETMSTAEKQRIELEKTLLRKPQALEAHRLMAVRVFCPHVSVIVDKPVTLKPGSELFTFRLGPLEKGWKPFGYENPGDLSAYSRTSVINRHPSVWAHSRPSEVSQEPDSAEGSGSQRRRGLPPLEELLRQGFDHDDEEDDGPEIAPLGDGCPMLVQTSRHIKILAQVPNVQISIHLARLLRFFSLYFEDIEKLRLYLGVVSERGRESTEEYIFLFKVLLDRLGKYLLLPNLELSLNIAVKVVATDQDVNVSFETNISDRKNLNPEPGGASINERKIVSPASSGPPTALKLSARVNVMDVIADALAIKNSLIRCAQVYERHCAEDAAAAEAEMRSDGEEEEQEGEEEEGGDGEDGGEEEKVQGNVTLEKGQGPGTKSDLAGEEGGVPGEEEHDSAVRF